MTIQGPIPKDDQLDNMFYCDKCPKSFKDKAYCRVYMTVLRDSNVGNVVRNFSLTCKYWNTEHYVVQKNKD